jgi:hypothetical protein
MEVVEIFQVYYLCRLLKECLRKIMHVLTWNRDSLGMHIT